MKFIDEMFDGMYEREFLENLRNPETKDIAQMQRDLRTKYDKLSAFANAGIGVLTGSVLAGIAYLAKEKGFTDISLVMNIGSGGITGISLVKLLRDLKTRKNSNEQVYKPSPIKSDLSIEKKKELIKIKEEQLELLTERMEKGVERAKEFLSEMGKLNDEKERYPETYHLRSRYNVAVDHNQIKYAKKLQEEIIRIESGT